MTAKKKTSKVRKLATPAEKMAAILLLKNGPVNGRKYKLPPAHFGPRASSGAKSAKGWFNALAFEVRPIKGSNEIEFILQFNTLDFTDVQLLALARELHDILCKGVDEGIRYLRGKAIYDELTAAAAAGDKTAAATLINTRQEVARARTGAGAPVSAQLLDVLLDAKGTKH